MQIAEKENTMPKSDPSQSGRSMVEMLLVLVIMGVLSVGGIAGFNWGMNRYRANRVVSEMQRDSAILKQRYRLAGQLNSNTNRVRISDASYASQINAEIDDMTVRYTTTPYEADAFADCGAGRFVQVAKIPGDICDHLIEMDSLSPVARYTGCPVVMNGAVLVQADGKIVDDVECLEQDNALVIGVRPDTQGGAHGAAVVSERSCRVKGDVIAHGTERDCGRCVDGVMQRQPTGLGECETCGPATGYMIQDDPTCGGCTPSDVCHECVDGSEVLIDAGKTKVKTGSPDTCVECLIHTDCTDPAKPVCNADNACEACPPNSSTTVTDQQIGATGCYCESGYAVNDSGDGCIVDACTDNNDCGGNGSGYFCAYYMEGGYGSYAKLSCETGATGPIGHCLRVSDYSNSDGDYIWSTKWMDWFSAENFCAGLTETNHMSSFSDLGPIPPGDVITDEIAELQGYGLTGKHVWVTNLNNSCRAHCVRMSDGAILVSNRNFTGEYGGDGGCTALCAKPPSCPEHSSRAVTEQRIGETDCYCKAGYMVNGTGDACVVETNICGYSLDSTQSDCNYTFESVYAADCNYTYTRNGDGSVSASGGSCDQGKYCNIQWTAQSWSAGSVPWVTDSSMGQLYGKCQSLGVAVTTSGGDMLVSGTSCGAGQYCGLFWTAETWSGNPPNVTNSSAGTIYGKCQSLGTYIPALTIGTTRLNDQKTCGEGQYCQAQYSNPEGTATISDNTTGAMYGTCVNR